MRCIFVVVFVCFQISGAAAEVSKGQPVDTTPCTGSQCNREKQGSQGNPFFVKSIPTEKAKEAAKQEADEKADKASSDWWLVKLTGALVVATILLVVVTGGLVVLGFLQLRENRDSIAAAVRSADIAEAALTSFETPYLFPVITVESSRIPESNPTRCIVTFQNYGRSPALVRGVHLSFRKEMRMPGPLALHKAGLKTTHVVRPDQLSEPHSLHFFEADFEKTRRENKTSLFLVGYVRYADLYGAQYVTALTYVWSPKSKIFRATGKEKHNSRRRLEGDELKVAQAMDN